MAKTKKSAETEIKVGTASNRNVLFFHPKTGDQNRWRGQLAISMRGRLSTEPTRIPSDNLREAFQQTDEYRAWGRLLVELESSTTAFLDAVEAVELAEDAISAALTAGRDTSPHEAKRGKAVSARDSAVVRRDAVLSALPVARQNATDTITRLGPTADLKKMDEARAAWDTTMEEAVVGFATAWEKLEDARETMRRCSTKPFGAGDVDRLLGGAPDVTPTADLLLPEPEPAASSHHAMAGTGPMRPVTN